MKYFVGIDIGKTKHVSAIINEGQNIKQAEIVSFNNTLSERDTFREKLKRYPNCHIAIESIGGWAQPLDQELLSDGHEIFTIHPLRLSRSRELYGQAHKTDEQDAKMLAWLLRQADQNLIPELNNKAIQKVYLSDSIYLDIKQLARHHFRLSQDATRVKNRLTRLVSCYLSEIGSVFKMQDGKICLSLLSQSSCPVEWRNLSLKKIQSYLVKKSNWKKKYRSVSKEIKKLAKEKDFRPLPLGVKLEINHLSEELLNMKLQKQKVKETLKDILLKTPEGRVIITIPGCDVILGSMLIGEIMPLKRFRSHNELAMYVGMTKLKHESGKMKRLKNTMIVNRKAKWAIKQLALINRRCFHPSRAYCDKKETEGKSTNQAVLCLGRQLVKVLFAMLKRQESFSIDRVK